MELFRIILFTSIQSLESIEFYEDLFQELSKYGEIESLNICDNLADHMVGNVYVQFREEEHAANALRNLTGRFYAGRPIIVDFSPVTDFREATCRQYEENTCNRGGYCNFMHLKRISRELRRELFGKSHRRHSRSRSRSPYRHHSYEERSRGSRGHSSRRHDDRDNYHESRSRRHRSISPGHRRGRSGSRSPGHRRNRSSGIPASQVQAMFSIAAYHRICLQVVGAACQEIGMRSSAGYRKKNLVLERHLQRLMVTEQHELFLYTITISFNPL
uniref:Uncharacterized protein n=1 Tax=Cannabis sativa TaxID=3483 RepID=A0A803PTT2_CANSA